MRQLQWLNDLLKCYPPPVMSKQILSAMFDVITWKNEETAYLECPGKHLHSGKNAKKDCRVNLNGAPTIFCLHSSCSGVIEEANYKFRRAIWENEPGEKKELTEEDKLKIKAELEQKRKDQVLRDWANNNKERILKKYEWPMADVIHDSPFQTEDPSLDAHIFIKSLYGLDEVLWNGPVFASGKPINRQNFKRVSEWLKEPITGNFTCPSTFREGTYSRSNENVVSRPYLVAESDYLSLDETCSFYNWMREFLELKAIVYTGGKSAHGWFKFPTPEMYERLKIILPEFQFDEALFKPSQPVRMPGVKRGDKWQSIYWLNL